MTGAGRDINWSETQCLFPQGGVDWRAISVEVRTVIQHRQGQDSVPCFLPKLAEQTLTSTELRRMAQKQDAPSLSAVEENVSSIKRTRLHIKYMLTNFSPYVSSVK